MSGNKGCLKAKERRDDEYYTRLSDIEKELAHHIACFEGKTIYCNCDNPAWSQFFVYFMSNFTRLKLKRVLFTFLSDKPYLLDISENGTKVVKTPLKGDGDFRSDECIDILKQCDIVVTNPPFSLFREFVSLLFKHKKQFLIIGAATSIAMKVPYHHLLSKEMWLGYEKPHDFVSPTNGLDRKTIYCYWFTNIGIPKKNPPLRLTKSYNEKDYPKYDDFNVIYVDRIENIPYDYHGPMAVPITIFYKYNPDQIEILDADDYAIDNNAGINGYIKGCGHGQIDGKGVFVRAVIRLKSK